MSNYDYQDYEQLDESVYEENTKKSIGRKPKQSWSEVNRAKHREDTKKVITRKRRSSEKN